MKGRAIREERAGQDPLRWPPSAGPLWICAAEGSIHDEQLLPPLASRPNHIERLGARLRAAGLQSNFKIVSGLPGVRQLFAWAVAGNCPREPAQQLFDAHNRKIDDEFCGDAAMLAKTEGRVMAARASGRGEPARLIGVRRFERGRIAVAFAK